MSIRGESADFRPEPKMHNFTAERTGVMKKLWTILVVLLFLGVPAGALADKASERPGCRICGMYIDQYRDTSAQLLMKNGEKLET